MDPKRASITALITAYSRAYHATHDTPKIFDDFLIDRMYTPEEHAAFDHNLAERLLVIDPALAGTAPDQATALAHVMQTHHGPITLSRSRYTEDCLAQAVEAGVEQYVLLGAGLDTFAFRRPDLITRLQVFEVDHPATQAMKLSRLPMLGMQTPAQLHFIPLDFAAQDLSTALEQAGYDRQKTSFFSWLGVTYYLSHQVVFDTLHTIARLAPRNSSVVFDYMDLDAFDPEKVDPRVRLMQAGAEMVGEPMQSGFDPLTLGSELKTLGFDLAENLGPAEIEARYFNGRADNYHAFAQVHFARATLS
jgi:methyltransferase (TIGR00027 family)